MYVEYNIERFGGHIFMSECREATAVDIDRLKNKPCDHANCTEQLFVEESGWLYDLRSCPLCGAGLGAV